ncbi:MAG: VCBS repeat-containing protein [Desulfobulbaceae bacterium]|nr:MAG: VCBS repeat-containing protein [Desulfobulbaceae bacterium]
MIIQSSSVQLSSEHIKRETHLISEKLQIWNTGENRPPEPGENQANRNTLNPGRESVIDRVSLMGRKSELNETDGIKEGDYEDTMVEDLNIRILKMLIERLTGRRVKVVNPEEFRPEGSSRSLDNNGPSPFHSPDSEGIVDDRFGMIYERLERVTEEQRASFHAVARITNDAGEEVSVYIELSMQRKYVAEQSLSIRAGAALKDPLVLNFNGNVSQLSDMTFEFDLDVDGENDNFRFIERGSGYLVHDQNRDNVVNDGSELFGPQTGQGFDELAQFDQDKNGWIDENDQIFGNLKIWMLNEKGERTLVSLGKIGVGAIYVSAVDTPFDLKSDHNELEGQIRSTGIFLNEDGTAGTVQQVDIVV